MVRAGCVFVAGIHPSRTWTSGSFESVRWNACVHRLELGLYSHPKEFLGGMEFEPMLTPREKSPLPENVPRGGSNPRRCGQWAQALPTELFRPPKSHLFELILLAEPLTEEGQVIHPLLWCPSLFHSCYSHTHSFCTIHSNKKKNQPTTEQQILKQFRFAILLQTSLLQS